MNEYERAIDKVRDEMAKAEKDGNVQQAGELMTAILRLHPDYAAAVLQDGKTLAGAVKALWTYAQKHAATVGNIRGWNGTPAEEIGQLLAYYDITPEGDIKDLTWEVLMAMYKREGTPVGAMVQGPAGPLPQTPPAPSELPPLSGEALAHRAVSRALESPPPASGPTLEPDDLDLDALLAEV